MIKMKSYYVLLALVCSAFLGAMNGRECSIGGQLDPIKDICNKIDQDILGVNPDGWCKRIVGSYASVSKSYSFADKPQEAIEQLSKIENYIPHLWHDQGTFQRLKSSHWLVHYLLYELVQDKVRQLNAVKGSTIDDVLNVDKPIPGLSPQMSKFINQSAHSSYAQSRLLDKPVEDIWFDTEADEIHYAHLNGWGAGEVCTLLIPAKGKYVKGVTSRGKSILWSMEDGMQSDDCVPFSAEESQCFTNGYLIKNDYLAVLGNAGLYGIYSTISPVLDRNKAGSGKYMFKESEIFLFKRPTLASRLCQKALWNCSRSSDKEELMKLKNSQAAQGLKGFVQRNLFTKIDTEIKSIAAVSQAFEAIEMKSIITEK
jgi:hypothetical protein